MKWWFEAVNLTLEESAIQATTRGVSGVVDPLLKTESVPMTND